MDNPIIRYLEDAIAAEKSFETQLRGFAKEASLSQARGLFTEHADETRRQHEMLTERLEALGGSTSGFKSFLAQVFNAAPKMAQLGHDEEERSTQDLIMAFAVENAEVAMYESLRIAAEAAGDDQTAELAQHIQSQERETAKKVWAVIAPAAERGFQSANTEESANDLVMRYLQDAEAAERNFEDALASFSKAGDEPRVQSLMSMMSDKARSQHERLRGRIEALGGTTSSSKSLLAHLLAFSPLTAQMGHEEAEKNTQHLMITYAAAAAEMGMYEALATAAAKAGDRETEGLARDLQDEEEEDHSLVWALLPEVAAVASQRVLSRA